MKVKQSKLTMMMLKAIENNPQAYALIKGNKIEGTVSFFNMFDGTLMIYQISGLPTGEKENHAFFGFHVHEGKTCINDTAIPYEKTLGHFNPTKQDHPYHIGDLPPIFASHGTAWTMIFIDKFRPSDMIGRTLVIHEHADDFKSQPAGDSGMKIACGEIKKMN